MLNVPFTPDYDQRFTSQLGDVRYVFDARWNERGQVWTLDIARESDGVQLIAGVPLLGGQDCLAPYALGIGGLFPIDLSLTDSDPGPDDFGERVIVTWFSNDELAAIRAAQRAAGRPSTIVTGVVPPTARPRIPAGSPGSTTPVGTTINNVTIENIANVTNIAGGGLAFSETFSGPNGITDSSGDEVLIGSYLQLPNLNPNPTVALEVAVFASGAGGLRCYIGGTFEEVNTVGVPSGALAATAVSVSGAGIYTISASPANPAAPVLVKITMKSTAPATQIGVNIINGFLG
jgi:hypothetical protein